MSLNEKKTEIIQLITSNESQEAIRLTMDLAKDYDRQLYFKAINIAREWHDLEQEISAGTMARDQEHAEKNKLITRVLNILDSIQKVDENV